MRRAHTMKPVRYLPSPPPHTHTQAHPYACMHSAPTSERTCAHTQSGTHVTQVRYALVRGRVRLHYKHALTRMQMRAQVHTEAQAQLSVAAAVPPPPPPFHLMVAGPRRRV
jgi:hypothetical protein